MNSSFLGERGAFTPSIPRTPGYYASPARSQKNTQPGFSQTPYTQTSPNKTINPTSTYVYTPPPDESSVERRILYGKIFTAFVSILFPSFFLSGFLWVLVVALCFLIFGFLWFRDKGDYAVILGSFLLGVSLFYGTWPLWTSVWTNVSIKRYRGDSTTKVSYFHEEIVLDLRTYNEDFNTSEFLKDIAKTLELPEDSIRISKKYSGSDLSYVTITIVIVRKSTEARNNSYMEELRSRKNGEYLNKYKIIRVERAISRDEERRLHERTIRPPPPPKSYDDEILGGDANVEVLVGPTITISGGGHICYGEKANITFSMDGTGPWTIVYNRGPPDYEVFQFKTEYSPYTIQTERPGIYTLGRGGIHEWVTPFSIFERTHIEDTPRDTYCPAVEMKGQVYVYVHPMPDAHFSKSKLRSIRSRFDKNAICEGEKQQLTVELEGTAPWSLAYSVLYGEEPFEAPSFFSRGRRRDEANSWRHVEYIHNINKSPYVIDAEQSGEYRLLNVSDSYCTNTKFTEEEKHLTFVHVRGLPKARISGGVCQGDDITVTLLSGVIPWTLGYKINNKDKLVRDINDAIYKIPTEHGHLNTYIIDAIHDKSCNGTIVDGPVTITPMQNPTARIYGGGPVLEGKTVDVSIELTGKAPFSFTYALDDGNYITDTIVTDVYDNIYRIPVSKKGRYYLTSVSDSQCGRGSYLGEALVSLYQLPSGFLKISRDSYCKGSDAPTLQFNVRGTPPFTIEYSVLTDSGDTFRFSQTNIEESPYTTRAVDPGVYTFTSITDGYGNSVPLKYANTVTLKLSELPSIEWIDDTYYSCKKICEDETITLRAKLTGAAPWSISYTDGSQIFTESGIESSPHIISVSNPGNYRFVKIEDKNCVNKNVESKSICVEQKPSPQCVIMLEHKHGSEYHSCVGDEIKVKCNGTSPFKLVYYNGQRYTTKTSYDREFTIPLSSIGRHTFSELTDGSDCKGRIDIQVGGFRDSVTQSIMVDELPTVSLSTRQSSFTVCKGDAVDLPFIFTGKSPWSISYRYTSPNGIVSSKTKTNIMESSYILNLFEEGVYQFLNVSDSNCASSAIDVSTHLITISYYTPPRVKFINKSKLCEGDTLSMDFTGTPPYSFTYTIDGENAKTESNIFSSPYIINAKPSGVYQIVRVSDSRCAIESQDIDSVLVHPMPRANIGGGGTVCTGDQTNITINLTGTPPWMIKYYNTADNVERTERHILSSPHIIQTGKAGHYYLTAIADTYCHYERPKK